jgi:mannitol-1-phosphate 5-dehydrogenase
MKPATAVIFGAGKMAGGLLGQLLAQSNFQTVFVARRPEVVEAINRRQGYSLYVAGESLTRLVIRNCAALPLQDEERVAEAVADADVIFTAVGIDNLSAITPFIAEGLKLRGQAHAHGPLNIIACENLPGAGAYLRHQVVSAAPLEQAITVENVGGFSAALTRRIMTGGILDNGELAFTVNRDYDLIIDRDGLRGDFPEIQGAEYTNEFGAMVMRKLFLLNCGQAIAAYLGYQAGCRYVHEAATHPRIAPVVQGAVTEAQAALKAEFPCQAEAINREAEEALERVANPGLADTISRVARGPRRKLSPRERLVGPERLASQHHLPHTHLCLGIAAALAYDDSDDGQAVAMQQAIAAEGIEKILTEDCGLLPHADLARAIKNAWMSLPAQYQPSSDPSHGEASLEVIMRNVTRDLARRYDPEVVRNVVACVAEEFRDARVWNYVPVLLRRRAAEQLDGARS